MTPRPTALQSRHRPGMEAIDLRRLIALVVLSLAGAAILFSLYQFVALWRYQSGQETVSHNAAAVAAAIRSVVDEQRTTVAALAEDPRTRVVDPAARERIQAVLTRELDGAERVLLLGPRVELVDARPYPDADYSALAVALRAKDEGGVAGPLSSGLGGAPRLNWAVPLLDQGRLQGLMVVSFSFAPMARLLETRAGPGYLDIRRQGFSGAPEVLYNAGRSAMGNVERADTANTAGSLAVGYLMPRPYGLIVSSMVVAGLMLLLSVLVGLLAYVTGFRPQMLAGMKKAPTEAEEQPLLKDLVEEQMQQAEETTDTPGNEDVPKAKTTDAVDAGIFRAYDIRGVVGRGLTPEVVRLIGQSIGSEAAHRGLSQLVVARDGRHSGPELSAALIEGVRAAGIDVIDIGAAPTGVLYFATHHLNTGSGVMVTGSHNPPEYNGLKVMLGGETLSGDAIKDLYRRIVEADLVSGTGGLQEMDINDEYVERIASDIQTEEPLKVVVDCGNGIPGMLAPQVLEEIGCEVVPLYCEVDGDFPNHHPDPSIPANLSDLISSVREQGADLGVAFDGDGDRLGVVTRAGQIIYPDRLLMLFAEDVLLRNPGATIIYDVKCTGHLAKVVLKHGGSPLMWKTGHSLIKGKMKETGAALAGEMSGHFFFQERWYGFDDGIYAAARLLEILASAPEGVDETLAALPDSVSTPEIKVEMDEGEHYAFIETFKSRAEFPDARVTTIDGVRADYDDGWGLVRCSNTTPCLVLRFDAVDADALSRIQATFREKILAVRPDLELPF